MYLPYVSSTQLHSSAKDTTELRISPKPQNYFASAISTSAAPPPIRAVELTARTRCFTVTLENRCLLSLARVARHALLRVGRAVPCACTQQPRVQLIPLKRRTYVCLVRQNSLTWVLSMESGAKRLAEFDLRFSLESGAKFWRGHIWFFFTVLLDQSAGAQMAR